MLKRNLDPRDFLDSEARFTEWKEHGHYGFRAYRVWICRSGMFWFQRHEWLREGANQSELEPWIQTPIKSFGGATLPAPEEDE